MNALLATAALVVFSMSTSRQVRLDRPAHVRFDERQADRAVGFFRNYLRHTKGRFAGQPFNLRPFQECDIREIFGRVREDGRRLIRRAYIEIPKKQGKSEIAAGVALKLLFADDEHGAEVYGAAADRDQATIVYAVASAMVKFEPRLRKLSKIIDSTKRITVPAWGSFYRALSAEVAGKHGYNIHGVIFDEVHAQRNRRLWEVLTVGAGAAREQPLIYAITTAGVRGESPVAEELHDEADQILRGIIPCPDHFYPVIYGTPDDADWAREETWYECNPLLRDGIMRIDTVREEYRDAQRSISAQNSFRRFRLNQWVSQEIRWIDMDDWDRGGRLDSADPVRTYQQWVTETIRALKDRPCYLGLDLSTKLDVTALVLAWCDDNRIHHWIPFLWIPEDNIRDRSTVEADKYRAWLKQGFISATPGNSVDFATIRGRINELARDVNIAQIAFDPMFATQLSQQLADDGFTCVEFRQTFAHFTEPCTELDSALRDGRLQHGGHPVLRWMADCVTVQQRADGAIRPAKPDRMKSSKRIDGIVAGLMATSRAILDVPAPAPGVLMVSM